MAELTSIDTSEVGVPPSKRPRMSECGEKSMDYDRPHQHHMIKGSPLSDPQFSSTKRKHKMRQSNSSCKSNATESVSASTIFSPDKEKSVLSVPDDFKEDYGLCQTCHATVDHLRKKLGFNMGDDEKTSQNTIANRAQLFKRRNEFLIHACQCQDHTCSKPLCIKMKQLLHHARDCKMRASGKCSAHNFFIRMCASHNKECEEAKCAKRQNVPVPICATLKQKMRQRHQREQDRSFQLDQRRIWKVNQSKPSPPSGVNWRSEVNSDLRNHLIKKLVEAIYPILESQVPVDNQVASLYQFAVRVERSMFETANSREDYYQKLEERIYQIRKLLAERRKNRQNEQDRRMVLLDQYLRKGLKKSGSIKTRITKAVIQGPARAGKTSVKCLILSKPYTSNISTGCIESPQIAVGEFSMSRFGQQSDEYHWELVDHDTMVKKFVSEIKDQLQDVLQHSNNYQSTAVTSLIVSIPLSVLSKSSFSQFTSSNVSVHQSSFKHDTHRDNVTRELCDIVMKAYIKVNKLTCHKEWLYFIDCGGQIQFQQLVQAFVPCVSVLMLVTNLAEDLSNQSSTDLQCEDGRYCVSDYSPSVETLLRRLTLMVTSSGHQQQLVSGTSDLSNIIKIPEKVALITVATHRDDYDCKQQQNREKVETIEEKEEKLAQIFHSVESNLFYRDATSKKILHEVDGRKASRKIFDDPVIKEIRAELREQAFEVDIPLSWYAFEILLCKNANKGCGVLSLGECTAIGTGLGFTEEEVQSALKFFHLLNTILYYEGVSDLVFVFPNRLIEIVSELVVLVCKIRNNVSIGPGSHHCSIAAEKGIISKDVFIKLEKSLHISRSFPDFSSQLLEIFEHLLTATKISADQFFMPALLPLTDPSQFSPFNQSSLLYYFENGAPLGLFCAMIVNLLSTTLTVTVDDSDMSQLLDNPYFFFDNSVWSIDTTSPMYANVIALNHFDINEKVVFVESNDCYEVYFKCPEDKARLEKQIDSILSDTIMKRQFKSEIQPKKGSFCPCSQQPCHAAILRSRSLEARCTKSNKIVTLPKDPDVLSLEPEQYVAVTSDNTDNVILNSDKAVRALVQCTDIIVESTIDPFVLARKLFAKEIISEDVYKRVKDKSSRDTNEDRLETILDDIRDRVKYDAGILTKFVDILRVKFNRNGIADEIMSYTN